MDTLDYQHIVLAERYRVGEAAAPAADEIEMRQSRCTVFDDILKARVDECDIESVDGLIVGLAVFVENGIALIVIKIVERDSKSLCAARFEPRGYKPGGGRLAGRAGTREHDYTLFAVGEYALGYFIEPARIPFLGF